MGVFRSIPVKATASATGPARCIDGAPSSAPPSDGETSTPDAMRADSSEAGLTGIVLTTVLGSLLAAAEGAAPLAAAAPPAAPQPSASGAASSAAISSAADAAAPQTAAPAEPLSSSRSCESGGSAFSFNSDAESAAGVGVVPASAEWRAAAAPAHRNLHSSQVLAKYRSAAQAAASRMGIGGGSMPLDALALLLAHHKWSVEVLAERYFADDGTDAKVRGAAGVERTVQAHAAGRPPAGRSAAPFSCPICLDDTAASGGIALACGHDMCVPCWVGHLDHVMGTVGKACVFERCPESGCGNAITEGAVRVICAALEDVPAAERLASRWESFMLRQFTDVVKTMAACRRPGCPLFFEIAEMSVGVVKDVTCPCTESICFSCKGEGHAPATCKEAASWGAKSAEVMDCVEARERQRLLLMRDNEQVRRLRERVRAEEDRRARPEALKCPKCRIIMEKDGGCMFMMCGANAHSMTPEAVRAAGRGCGHEFCWTCLQPRVGHKGGRCTPPRIAPDGADTSEVERLIFAAILAEDASGPVEAAIAKANEELQRAIARNEVRAPPGQQRLVGGRTFWTWERVQHCSAFASIRPGDRMLHLNKARGEQDAALLDGVFALLRGQRFVKNLYVQQFYCKLDHPDWQSSGLLANQRMILAAHCENLSAALRLPLDASRQSILSLTAAITKQIAEPQP